METTTILAMATVAAAWTLSICTVRRWGPGRVRRKVLCPEKRERAKVLVEQREGAFGSLRAVDVSACSLLPAGAVDCDKQCLSRL